MELLPAPLALTIAELAGAEAYERLLAQKILPDQFSKLSHTEWASLNIPIGVRHRLIAIAAEALTPAERRTSLLGGQQPSCSSSSSYTDDTPAPAGFSFKEALAAVPSFSGGADEDIVSWLQEILTLVGDKGMAAKVARSKLAGKPKEWLSSLKSTVPATPDGWLLLTDSLVSLYGDPLRARTALEALKLLRWSPGSPITDHCIGIITLLEKAGITEEAARIDHLINSIPPSARQFLILSKASKMETAIQKLKLWERTTDFSAMPTTNAVSPSPSTTPRRCFICGDTGHLASFHRGAKPPRRTPFRLNCPDHPNRRGCEGCAIAGHKGHCDKICLVQHPELRPNPRVHHAQADELKEAIQDLIKIMKPLYPLSQTLLKTEYPSLNPPALKSSLPHSILATNKKITTPNQKPKRNVKFQLQQPISTPSENLTQPANQTPPLGNSDFEPSIPLSNHVSTSFRPLPMCPISIAGHHSQALLDSGAQISIIRRGFAEFLRLPISTSSINSFKGVDGKPVPSLGEVECAIVIGRSSLPISMIVAETSPAPILLGVDAMEAFGLMLDLRKRRITLSDGSTISLKDPGIHATCSQNTVIPPNGVANIQLERCYTPNSQLIYFHGFVSESLFVPPGIINPADPRVLAINPQNQPFTLKAGRILATLDICSVEQKLEPKLQISNSDQNLPILDKIKFGNLPDDILTKYKKLIVRFEKIFTPITGPAELPLMPIELVDEKPIVSRPQCREPFRHTTWLKETIEGMLSSGIIRYSNSAFHSPVVIVKKPQGRGWRLCVDYRALNSKTKPIYTVLPDPENILAGVRGFKRMSSVDLTSGFWQLGILPEHAERTAFSTSFGVFEYLAAPMGLRNVPHYFNRAITTLFKPEIDEGYLKTYFDDLNIFSDSDALHLTHLEKIFQKCLNSNLKINPDKTLIAFEEGPCLGFTVSGQTIKPQTQKAQAILDMRTPADANEVRVFMGLVNFYRRFLPDLSRVAAPLTDLTKKNRPFEWSTQCQQAFVKIKHLISSDIALHHFDPDAPTCVTSDASEQGWAASLKQSGKVIAFASGRFSVAQSKYAPHERECLGALNGLEKFRHYLVGGPVTLVTDSSAISWLQKSKELSPKLFRWSLRLQEFSPEIVHNNGSLIPMEDCGSRLPHDRQDPTFDEPSTLEAPSALFISYTSTFPQSSAVQTRAMKKSLSNITQNSHQISNSSSNSKSPLHSESPSNSAQDSQQNTESPLNSEFTSTSDQKSDQNSDIFSKSGVPSSFGQFIRNSGIPKSDWLARAHNHPQSGHFGARATFLRLNRFVRWPGMLKDIVAYVKSCPCQLAKSYPRQAKQSGSLTPVKKFDIIGIDFLGPFPPTSRNNRYIFFLIDIFTNSTFAFPTPTADLATTESLLKLWISQHDTPHQLISDHHTMFDGPSAQLLWKKLSINKIVTAPHHQSTNGSTERAVSTLKNRLRTTASSSSEWDSQLFDAITALNHTPNISSKSPFELKFGHTPRGSFHPTEPIPLHTTTPTTKLPTTPTTKNPYIPGDFVKLRSDVPPHFTSPRWTGPYLVVSTTPHFTTIISPQFKITNTHIDKLAPYHPPPNFKFASQTNEPSPRNANQRTPSRELFEVEDIIGHKINSKGEITYLTKWVGFPIDEATYEPPQNFSKLSLLSNYNKKHNLFNPIQI